MKKTLLLVLLTTLTSFAQDYQFLGSYNSQGTPLYLEPENDVITNETMQLIENALPESYPVPDYNPQYISSGYGTDLILEDMADVFVTFVTEGAGYKNVLGFYTYDLNNPTPPKPTAADITIIFPNVSLSGSGGELITGNKVNIGRFPANTGIGWVLLANGWKNGEVTDGLWQLYSNPDYNPEQNQDLRYHNVLLSDAENERILLGFEDIRRDYASCDQDFNDALFFVSANPFEALDIRNYGDISSYNPISTGNEGGLESEGDLSSLIAKRNLNRLKNKTNKTTKAHQQKMALTPGRTTGLANYIPLTGMFGTETAYVSSPDDLLEITNAVEVYAADYYEKESRVAAVLATKTEGEVYNHTKVICDRLNGSKLLDVRPVLLKGHQLIQSKIERADGTIEYTASFSVQLNETYNEVFSFWNLDQYPEGNYNNFQIWGASYGQVFNIANYILERLLTEKELKSTPREEIVPKVFVSSGYYSQGKLHLDIINKEKTNGLYFVGNSKETEISELKNITENISLSGTYNETITIETGSLFDIGFSLQSYTSNIIDALYLADGPWGLDYIEDTVTVSEFLIENQLAATDASLYQIERNPSISGQIKETLNLFRHILPGNQTFNISEYSAVQFEIKNSLPVEVILLTDAELDWENRLRFKLDPHENVALKAIDFKNFKDASGKTHDFNNVRSIIFSVQGDFTTYKPFQLQVKNLAFGTVSNIDVPNSSQSSNKAIVYPNPFKTETNIVLPKVSKQSMITIYDAMGRKIDYQVIASETSQITYKNNNLKAGVYFYRIVDDKNNSYSGQILVE